MASTKHTGASFPKSLLSLSGLKKRKKESSTKRSKNSSTRGLSTLKQTTYKSIPKLASTEKSESLLLKLANVLPNVFEAKTNPNKYIIYRKCLRCGAVNKKRKHHCESCKGPLKTQRTKLLHAPFRATELGQAVSEIAKAAEVDPRCIDALDVEETPYCWKIFGQRGQLSRVMWKMPFHVQCVQDR